MQTKAGGRRLHGRYLQVEHVEQRGVVVVSGLWVGEHREGLVDAVKALGRAMGVGAAVRVVPQREAPEVGLDFIGGGLVRGGGGRAR